MKKIELGDTVKDIHSGFVGTAVVYSKFFNGCEQFEVAPKVGKDNRPVDSIGIDIQSLKIVKRGVLGIEIDKINAPIKVKLSRSVGGPNQKAIHRRGF